MTLVDFLFAWKLWIYRKKRNVCGNVQGPPHCILLPLGEASTSALCPLNPMCYPYKCDADALNLVSHNVSGKKPVKKLWCWGENTSPCHCFCDKWFPCFSLLPPEIPSTRHCRKARGAASLRPSLGGARRPPAWALLPQPGECTAPRAGLGEDTRGSLQQHR